MLTTYQAFTLFCSNLRNADSGEYRPLAAYVESLVASGQGFTVNQIPVGEPGLGIQIIDGQVQVGLPAGMTKYQGWING